MLTAANDDKAEDVHPIWSLARDLTDKHATTRHLIIAHALQQATVNVSASTWACSIFQQGASPNDLSLTSSFVRKY